MQSKGKSAQYLIKKVETPNILFGVSTFLCTFAPTIQDNSMSLESKIMKYEDVRMEYQKEIQERMSEFELLRNNEALFSAHSCAIEGNSFTVDDTRILMEQDLGMTVPAGKKLYELLEIRDHLRAYEYVVNNLQHPLDEAFLKEVNRLVTEHTLSYHAPGFVPGEYTTVDMAAGDTLFGEHEKLIAHVPQLLESTERAIVSDTHPMIVAARFHGYYEYLHPFRDGNGRTGRLISNYILLRKGHPQLVIKLEERQQYISALKQIRKEGTDEYLMHFFFDVAIAHMQEDIGQKKKNTKPKIFLF